MPPHRPRKRLAEKPLRTYGRRCASTAEQRGELLPPPPPPPPPPHPSGKRARFGPERRQSVPPAQVLAPMPDTSLDRGDDDDNNDTTTITTTSSLPLRSAPGAAEEPSHPRSSILQYFRPLPAESTPQRRADKPAEAASSPPPPSATATPTLRARRRPRLLKIRGHVPPVSLPADVLPEDAPSAAGVASNVRAAACSSQGEQRRRDLPRDEPHHPPKRKQVGNRNGAVHRGKAGDGTGGDEVAAPLKRPPPVVVQTTLNISSQAAFAECRVCDMVWNPLYPDDVRYHERRHKSLLTRKRKQEEAEL
ncbi:hypothetical protein E4U41_001433 [Claviceps citrina]|nr:hypothetical protein E4U41_001433 [Claviceps citrina]